MRIGDFAFMSLSFSDCISDLLCAEDSADFSAGSPSECTSDIDSAVHCFDEESIAGFIEDESGFHYSAQLRSISVDPSAREQCAEWMFKVRAFYGFQALTAYLAVNYFDRFLCSHRLPSMKFRLFKAKLTFESEKGLIPGARDLHEHYGSRFIMKTMGVDRGKSKEINLLLVVCVKMGSHKLPESDTISKYKQTDSRMLQLLSVACLSLAAKLEEPLVPSLFDFQVEGAKFIFEQSTIQRMELLVLSVLDWRLQSVTPFCFISFFSCKADAAKSLTSFLISRSTDIILSTLQEASLLEYRPSSIAAAAVLCAASVIPSLPLVTLEHAESWCDGLSKVKTRDCYKLMQNVMVESEIKEGPKPQRAANKTRVRSSSFSSSDYTSSPSPPSSSSSTPPTTLTKRRKFHHHNTKSDSSD